MAKFTIYSPSGAALYTGTPTFTGQYMKPGLLEFREVALPALVDLVPGCYVDYTRTGHRYRIYTAPQLKKQARTNTYGGAFVYQSVQLYDASKMLEYCPFRDLVLGDNRIHFSTQPSISTFEGCDGLARRFEACLVDQYGANSWAVRIATQAENPDLHDLMLEPRDFTVSGVNILECLEKIYEIWPGVGWLYTVENSVDTIVIGGVGTNSGTYAYGKGNGLTSLTRTAANAEEIANRIFAYGSSRNMLPRWYNSQNIKDAESVDIQNLMIPVSSWGLTDNLPDAAKAFVEDAASILKNGLRPATVYFDGNGEYPEIYPSLRETTIGMVRTAIGDSTAKYYPSTAIYTDPSARVDKLLSAQAAFDSGKAGADGKSSTDVGYIAYEHSAVTPITIPAGSVHTESFASGTIAVSGAGRLDIELSYPGIGLLTGCGSVYLDFSFVKVHGGASTTIYTQRVVMNPGDAGGHSVPEGKITYAGNTLFESGDSLAVAVNLVFNNQSGATGASAFLTNASGTMTVKASNRRDKTFTISLRQLGFDINEQADLGNGKTIAMRTGMCAGRSFAIKSVQYDSTNDCWNLECWRTEDESLSQWFPNTDYPVRGLENAGQSNEYPGDEFVLLDIAMPTIYVQMAEQKLLTAAQELLADTAVERWQYSPEIDAKFMVENNRIINAGEYLLLSDADIIGQAAESVLVDTVTINEGESAIPTYKVTLRDRKKKTWTESQSPETSSSKSVGSITTTQPQSTSGVADSFFQLDEDGNVTLKPQYQNLWVPGWLASGGVGADGGGGGGLIDTVLGVDDLDTPIVLEDLSETFSAKAIQTIWDAVKELQQTEPDLSEYGTALSFTNNVATYLLDSDGKFLRDSDGNFLTTAQSSSINLLNADGDIISHIDLPTSTLDLTAYATRTWVQAQGYIEQETDPTVPDWAKEEEMQFSALPELYALGTKVTDAPGLGILLGVSVMSANLATSAGDDTSRVQWDYTNDAWHFYGNVYVDGFLASGGIGDGGGGGGYGVEEITSNEDGTVDFHFTGGDVTTVDLNHEHPQYASKIAETSQPSGGFLPDVVYELGTLTGSVTFALASAVSGQVNHYFWTFTAGSTAPTITWPSGITWADSAPTITANKKYQISILDGVAAYMEA